MGAQPRPGDEMPVNFQDSSDIISSIIHHWVCALGMHVSDDKTVKLHACV